MTVRVGFLLGRAAGSASVLPEIVGRLERAGVAVAVHLAADGAPVPDSLLGADLVALRACGRPQLAAARALEHAGVRCCNSVHATGLARDKLAATLALARAGVPVPATEERESWDGAVAAAAARPALVKARTGSRGGQVLDGDRLPARAPFPGPYLVQERVDHDGADRKLYVVGGRVQGVLRRWPAETLEDKLGRPFAPDPSERELALAAGRALGLELYGVDVVAGRDGAFVVDVNAFPGYKGVPGAARAIAGYLYEAATRGAVACAS